MNIIIMGPIGSGKGTQAARLCERLKIPHISTGDLFRENIKAGTDIGKIAQHYLDGGKLVPDDVVDNMVRERLTRPDCKTGWILDGYPRTLSQANTLSTYAHIDFALELEVNDDEVIERIGGRLLCNTCGKGYHVIYLKPHVSGMCDTCETPLNRRKDDEPDVIMKRLEAYHIQTRPLLDYYRERGTLRIINGSQSIDDVFSDIIATLHIKI